MYMPERHLSVDACIYLYILASIRCTGGSLNNNEIVVLVESKLLEGVTREDIFRELGGTDDVARVIASTPDFQLRQKYAKLNWILVAIVTYLGLLKFVLYLPEFINTHFSLYFLPVLLMIPSAAIYFALQI